MSGQGIKMSHELYEWVHFVRLAAFHYLNLSAWRSGRALGSVWCLSVSEEPGYGFRTFTWGEITSFLCMYLMLSYSKDWRETCGSSLSLFHSARFI
ncbi:hypothetical protein B0H67DRAFT_207848 [Lasiosphaeris hirsuta]|uniref:Uncharacterized protein n=1 Tax=Lasiosphaeris hirsuta TaxID=260670 RepID=A0AA40E1M1_9PEZI|nr:hypothetical protein B0H67DRAFT_207848 [Lasiosphaeris hirsuta]